VDPVPNPLLPIKSGSAENLTLDLWICSQELLPQTTEAVQINRSFEVINFKLLTAM
jgi:hypothetical protein